MENEMQDAPREDGFEFAMAPIPTENADDVHYVFDSLRAVFHSGDSPRIQNLQKNFFVSCIVMNLYLLLQKLPVPSMLPRVPVK
ncbi:MAG: hypothetical protein ACLRVO_19415 [Blautia wexlerae]